ncbi:MAG: AIR synthase family protein [Desulfurococcales archaeon]|nr:AIR synthase family protein [Desulfurococcales archaeon]
MQERNGKRWIGKLPLNDLSTRVLSRITAVRYPQTLIGPTPGEDAAVIDLGMCELVIHTDPITEAGSLAGWLALNVAANDVAVTGAKPRWATLVILLPEDEPEEHLEAIVESTNRASRELEVEIVGGHTEVTPGLQRPIVIATAWGCTCKGCSVPTGGAKPGDMVIQVKPAGLEGTAILATDFKDLLVKLGVDEDVIDRAALLQERISVVREALALAERGLATSMHDPTEGGLIGGLVEIAYASGASIIVDEEKILVSEETRIISSRLSIDPLKLISSGTLLATVDKGKLDQASSLLDSMGVEYSVIGRVVERDRWILKVMSGEGYVVYNEPPQDEISRVWAGRHGQEGS